MVRSRRSGREAGRSSIGPRRAVARRRLERVHDGPEQAAGEGAADLLRAAEKRGSHDLKFGFEDLLRFVPLRHQRHVGRRIACSYPTFASGQRRSHPVRRHRRRGRLRHRLDGGADHRSALQRLRAGSLVAEQPAVDHRRRAHRPSEALLQRRRPEAGASPTCCAGRDRIFPAESTVAGATLVEQHGHRPASGRQL